MNATKRWRAAVLAVLAAFSLALAGCNDASPADTDPGTVQDDGNDDQDDDDGY